MKPVITPEESSRLDAESAVPVATLMERAGMGVALHASRLGAGYGRRVAILAGTGNNGGDGWVAARYLMRRGAAVTVHSIGYPRGDGSAARAAAVAATRSGVQVRDLEEQEPVDLVIDALFGVGFRGSLPDGVVPWTETNTPVLAVDLPSGLDATTGEASGPVFTATRTVTFHALKTGHILGVGPEHSGAVSVVDIGLTGEQAELRIFEESDLVNPGRPRDAHKWSVGSVVVVGGAPGITGAALLTATGAQAGGAGAASVVCPGGVQQVYAFRRPGVMTAGIGTGDRFGVDDAAAVLAAADRYDVMVLGPGLGPVPPGFVAAVAGGWRGPLVIDADGLNALSGVAALDHRPGPTVITPHAAEFGRLTGEQATYQAAAKVATSVGITVLLKGNPTFVLGNEKWVIRSGGPELATIGTGDVLAGVIAARWAGGQDPETAARSAAYLHGVAGARLAERETVTAETLVAEIGTR